jgi:hypothetical protein
VRIPDEDAVDVRLARQDAIEGRLYEHIDLRARIGPAQRSHCWRREHDIAQQIHPHDENAPDAWIARAQWRQRLLPIAQGRANRAQSPTQDRLRPPLHHATHHARQPLIEGWSRFIVRLERRPERRCVVSLRHDRLCRYAPSAVTTLCPYRRASRLRGQL